MEEIIAVIIGLAIAFYVAWIVLAFLFKILAWVMLAVVVTATLSVFGGLLHGLVIPLQVLRGTSDGAPSIATPEEVKAGRVIKRAPRGPYRAYGWPEAWPTYVPYQAGRDLRAVRARCAEAASRGVGLITGAWEGMEILGKPAAVLVTPIGLGYAASIWISFVLWSLTMLLVEAVVWFFQRVISSAAGALDKISLRRERASMSCPHCFETFARPVYLCPICGRIHADVSPGPLGIFSRRCACGNTFPTTVRRASKHLDSRCPSCRGELAEGAGTRRTLVLPVFGAVAAGKTSFFASSLTALQSRVGEVGGTFEAKGDDASTFLATAEREVSKGVAPNKTAVAERPKGLTYVLTARSSQPVELQLIDAAGELFTSLESTSELTYVRTSQDLIFILDPLALPDVRARLRESNDSVVATGDQEDAYASLVDAGRNQGVNLGKHALAVVVTKTDVLEAHGLAGGTDPRQSADVRQWLKEHDLDGFVRRIESDFGTVRYFFVDARHERRIDDPLTPLSVLAWAFDRHGIDLDLVPAAERVTAAAGSTDTEDRK